MQTQRGEMQSMGLSLQVSLEEVKSKIADWKMDLGPAINSHPSVSEAGQFINVLSLGWTSNWASHLLTLVGIC